MSDQVHTSHSLALKLVATAALVAALLWGAWVTREIASSPEQRIVTVRLAEAVPVTGGLMLDLLEIEGEAMPGGPSAKRGRYSPRKPGPARIKATKLKRKVERRRK